MNLLQDVIVDPNDSTKVVYVMMNGDKVSEKMQNAEEAADRLEAVESEMTAPDSGSGGPDTSDATALASDVVKGKTAYIASGKTTGTMSVKEEESFIPAEDAVDLPNAFLKNCQIASIVDSAEYTRWLALASDILEPKPIAGYTIEYKDGSLKNTVTGTQKATITGSYSVSDGIFNMNGARIVTDPISTPYGSFEMYCAVNSNFNPSSANNWYERSCLFGCELGGTQKDFGLVLDSAGKAGLGYNTSAVGASSKVVKDGLFHHYVIVNSTSNMKLYIDGELAVNLNYTMAGSSPSTYGIFWNNTGTGTIVQGKFKLFRFYPRALSADEVSNNYNVVNR